MPIAKAKQMKKSGADTQPQAPVSFCDAAERILREKSKPLNYREIAREAVKRKLIETESEHPEISMHVSIRTEMKRREVRGEPQRFVFLGEGLFTLVELTAGSPTERLKTALEHVRESRKSACRELYELLTKSDHGSDFEIMVSDLLVAMGYQDVRVIGGKDDQGVDILCEKGDSVITTKVAIQCKCKSLSSKIGPKDVSTLRDNLSTYQCQRGILVTTTELNDGAKLKSKEAGKEPIHFIEHDAILDLFAEYGVGIRSESFKYFQIDVSKYDFLK
jgi:restriction endonuclease Mrr